MDERDRIRFRDARVARLATVGNRGPHLVPITFALLGEVIVSAVDAKPKKSRALRRLANISAEPSVAVLVDEWSEDWAQLWWVRADGVATIQNADTPLGRSAIQALAAKYPQYVAVPPPGPVIAVEVKRWVAWAASPG